MTDITLTDKQADALGATKEWFKNDIENQQVFSIAGYAGTGKSTIVKYLVDDLGLDADTARRLFREPAPAVVPIASDPDPPTRARSAATPSARAQSVPHRPERRWENDGRSIAGDPPPRAPDRCRIE